MWSVLDPIGAFYARHKLALDTLGAFISMVASALGIFFIYRWARLIERSDDKVRKALLGEWITDAIKLNSEVVVAVASAYIAWKTFVWLVSASRWRRYLEKEKAEHLRREAAAAFPVGG